MEAGADGFEFDVRLSRDGIPVVIHDDNLKRTGLDPRGVAELTAADLKEIDIGRWFNQTFVNERIPTLKEVLDLFEPSGPLLYVEMKSPQLEREKLTGACCELLNKSALKNRTIVECFDLAAIELLKRLDSEIRTAALFEPKLTKPSSFDGGRLVNAALEVSANEIALHHRLARPATIQAARRAGLQTVVWTVDDPRWVGRANSDGIDALITNDPGLMARRRDSVN